MISWSKLPYDLNSFLSPRYDYLDHLVRRRYQPGSFKFVASKVAADGLLFGPLDLGLFFSYVGLASGRSLEQVKDDVKRDIIPALVLGGAIWPAVQIANFRFIPVRYQLLYVNLFCLLDSCFLSWIEQQGDAAWKQWFPSFQKKIEDQKSNAWSESWLKKTLDQKLASVVLTDISRKYITCCQRLFMWSSGGQQYWASLSCGDDVCFFHNLNEKAMLSFNFFVS